MLNQLQELIDREASLLQDVGQSAFCDCGVHRRYRAPRFVADSSLERSVASSLTQFDKPSALQSAQHAFSGNNWEFGRHEPRLPGHFNKSPEGLRRIFSRFRLAPGLDIKLDRFAQIVARGFDVSTLRRDVEFRATRDVEVLFLSDEGRKAIRHNEMVSNQSRAGKLGNGTGSTKGETWLTN